MAAQQPAAPATGQEPSQTLIPFDTLPACARQCYVLFDVNGKCVPPNVPTTEQQDYVDCFCDDSRLAPFKTGTSGVCDNICADSPDSQDSTQQALESIKGWFDTFCNTEAVDNTDSGKKKDNGGGDWLSGHWQWIVMLVILVVGIAAIWVGACIWRRHYIRKKERAHALGKKGPNGGPVTTSWGPGAAPTTGGGPAPFMTPPHGSGAVAPHAEKQSKRVSKWVPKERT